MPFRCATWESVKQKSALPRQTLNRNRKFIQWSQPSENHLCYYRTVVCAQIFGRSLANGSYALVFYNPASASDSVSVSDTSTWQQQGTLLPSPSYSNGSRGGGGGANISLCCNSSCWAELATGGGSGGQTSSSILRLSSGGGANAAAAAAAASVFTVEDIWMGADSASGGAGSDGGGATVRAGEPFCVEVGAAGESSRTFRLDPLGE